MIDKGLGLLVILIFLGLMFLLSIAVSIVKRKERFVRNIALSFALIALFLMVFTAGYLVVKSVLKGKDLLVETSERLVGNEYYSSAMLDSLKSLEPTGVQIPTNYYTYFGMRDYYRFPIVYPYSIVGIDALDRATLYNESKVENILYSDTNAEVVLEDILDFSFDGYFFIATLYNCTKCFVLLEFSSQRVEYFESREALMERAGQIGFSAKQKTVNMYVYSQKF